MVITGICNCCKRERVLNLYGWCILCWSSVFCGKGAPNPKEYFKREIEMKDSFRYEPNETYWNLNRGKEISGREANTLLEAAPNSDVEALILLTIVPLKLKPIEEVTV